MTEHTPERDCRPGTGRLESDENGLVVERFANGDCSFDIFDAQEWHGGDEDGMFYARLIVTAVNCHADLLAALEALERRVSTFGNRLGPAKDNFDWSDTGDDRAMVEQARAAIAKARGE